MAIKRHLCLRAGVINKDFYGDCIICLENRGKQTQVIEQGDRIAQIIFLPFYTYHLVEKTQLRPTQRGPNGFGSTGRQSYYLS